MRSLPNFGRVLGIAVLVLAPILEFAVLIQVVIQIGWWTALVVLVGMVLGIWLIRRTGIRAWRELASPQQARGATSTSILNGGLDFLAGVGFLIPGLLSDVAALLLLLPGSRTVARRLLRGYLDRKFGRIRAEFDLLQARSRGQVIEGEVIDEEPTEGQVIKGQVIDDPARN